MTFKEKLYSIAKEMHEKHPELRKADGLDALIKEFLNGSVLSHIAPMVGIKFAFPWYSATHKIAKKTRDIQKINEIAGIKDTSPDDFKELKEIPECEPFLEFLISARNQRYSSDEVASHLFAVGNYCTLRLLKEVYEK